MLPAKPRFLLRLLLIGYSLVLSIEGGANVWINFIGKGRTWDLYPLAQTFWVACSVVVVIVLARAARGRPSMKRLAAVVIVLMFLDSFVDLCAMGHENWWAKPPVLLEWKWDALKARAVATDRKIAVLHNMKFSYAVQTARRWIASDAGDDRRELSDRCQLLHSQHMLMRLL